MQIRDAAADDIPRVVEMATRFIQASRYAALLTIDRRRLERLAAFLIDQGGYILLAERLEPPPAGVTDLTVCKSTVGMLAVLVAEHPMTGVLVADEIAWWVDPEHRKTAAAWRLLCAHEDRARHMGASVLKMVAPSDSDVGAIYERRGYRPLETTYFLEL